MSSAASLLLPQPAGGTAAGKALTLTHWLILIVRAIGFALRTFTSCSCCPGCWGRAIAEFGFRAGSEGVQTWLGLMFYLPTIFRRISGLIGGPGGRLPDELPRQRRRVADLEHQSHPTPAKPPSCGFST